MCIPAAQPSSGRPLGSHPPSIRPYRNGDQDGVYDVCVRTGAAGQDARGLYSNDDLIPDVYAGPYLLLEPDLAFILDDGRRPVGYVLGTASTEAFVTAYRRHWIPRMQGRHPPPPPPAPATAEQRLLAELFNPERMLRPELAAHPAHLHINLLPDYQRAGHGRALVEVFLKSAATSGAGSCHLAVNTANAAARLFYDRLGWHHVPVLNPGRWTFLARPTS